MILKSLQPTNWGPFGTDQVLEIEPDVTIITGSNDTGKSSLIQLLSTIYQKSDNRNVDAQMNLDFRLDHAADIVGAETAFGGQLIFDRETDKKPYVDFPHGGIAQGATVNIFFGLGSSAKSVSIRVHNGTTWTNANGRLHAMPRVLVFPTEEVVRDTISLAKPNRAERTLLELGFGSEFSAEKLLNLNKVLFTQQINRARARLQQAVKQLLPASMNFTLEITPVPPGQTEVMIQPIELEYGMAPLENRGRGVRTMVTILGLLLDVRHQGQQTLILFDEPETSLHADAQHMLRGLLESLAKLPTVQVIYATHSPSMINNMRPHSVRLLSRVLDGERIVTKISKRPTDRNFLAVRTSLGITPADSLLYAPITIIVEGPSDAIGIGMLLPKLQELQVPGFEVVDSILPQCHLIDGEGDSYLKQIPLAKSQKSRPVVFLDGDKVVTQETRTNHPEVPFILLDNKAEFEELINRDLYFQAIDQTLRQNDRLEAEELTPAAYDTWLASKADDVTITRRAYTKRIEAWINEVTQNARWDKPSVLKTAISLITEPSQVTTSKLLDLVQAIRGQLPSVN